jgi:ADP-ribose pyrophosphatase YjhB (NUDIX family)
MTKIREVERDEALEAAAEREFEEETGTKRVYSE